MKTNFKLGDKVYEGVRFQSWGTIIETNIRDPFPIIVKFDDLDNIISFTLDGKNIAYDQRPTLSFTEYDLVKGGFSQERPETLPERGDIVWVRDNQDGIWKIAHFIQKLQAGPYYFECSDYTNLVDRDTYKFMTTENPYNND